MKKVKLLLVLMLGYASAFAQWVPGGTIQTQTVSGQKQVRILWGSTNIFNMSDSLAAKLAVTGTAANSALFNGLSPSSYLNRANHTGTQAIGTINGLQTSLDSKELLSNKSLSLTNSTTLYPASSAVKSYVDNIIQSKLRWLIILTGESNPAGAVQNSFLTPADTVTNQKVRILNNTILRLEKLKIGTNNNLGVNQPNMFGFELQLAKSIPDSFFIVKAAYGGASVESALLDTGAKLGIRVDTALKQIRAMGYIPVPIIIHSLGVNNNPQTPAQAATFKSNTIRYFKYIRSKIGYAPILYTKFNLPIQDFTRLNNVIDTLANGGDPWLFAIDPTGATVGTNGQQHWGRAGDSVLMVRAVSLIANKLPTISTQNTFAVGKSANVQSQILTDLKIDRGLVIGSTTYGKSYIGGGDGTFITDSLKSLALIKRAGFSGQIAYAGGTNIFSIVQSNTIDISQATSFSEKLRIDADGDVTSFFGGFRSNTDNRGVVVANGGLVRKAGIGAIFTMTSNAPLLLGHMSTSTLTNTDFANGSFTTNIYIATDGKVKIGAGTPSEILDVGGNLVLPIDGSFLSVGGGAGILKKPGAGTKFVIGTGNDFTVDKASTSSIAVASTYTTIFNVSGTTGNVTATGNITSPSDILSIIENKVIGTGTTAPSMGFMKASGINAYYLTANGLMTHWAKASSSTDVRPAASTYSDLMTLDNAGNLNLPILTASQPVFTDASKNLVSGTSTGTGAVVLAGSPALTGTPTVPTPGTNVNTTQAVNGAWVNTYYGKLSGGNTFTGINIFDGLRTASGSVLAMASSGGFRTLIGPVTATQDNTLTLPNRTDQIATLIDVAKMSNFIASGNGATTSITFAHGYAGVTSVTPFEIAAHSLAAGGFSYTTIDATNVTVVYSVAPVTGTNNLSYTLTIKP